MTRLTPRRGGEGRSAGSGDNGMRRIPAAAMTVCFGTGSGYFGDGSVGAQWEGVNVVYGCCYSRFWVVYCRM